MTVATEIDSPAHDDAATVLATELEAFVALLRTLGDEDWAKPTDCPGWTVQDIAAHVLGQLESAASTFTLFRRRRAGHRRYPEMTRLAALTQQQVDDLSPLPPPRLIESLARTGPKAVRANRRLPGPIRRLDMAWVFPEEPLPDSTLGYIVDVLSARDTWMHRVDICQATGRSMVFGQHDQHIVEQVVRDLGLYWTGPAVVLKLTGPVGGSWRLGEGPPVATVHAETIGYMRTLSGRDDEPVLEADGDPAAANAVAMARVVF